MSKASKKKAAAGVITDYETAPGLIRATIDGDTYEVRVAKVNGNGRGRTFPRITADVLHDVSWLVALAPADDE